MSATTTPPSRPDDAPSVEELILELSERPLSSESETVDVSGRADAINEIIMMCRAYIVSIDGRIFARQLYNRRRH
jgi:hypothetical protein